ncbi:hypothetical protein [Peribacillus frigoritolerans]|uniref:hypothetical protein n=1 Tax=Peribacillus frigoritolerans TaxID=450367 RepID=UPI003306015B
MEPTQKKNFLFLMIVFVSASLVIMYIFSLRSQLNEVRSKTMKSRFNPYPPSKTRML